MWDHGTEFPKVQIGHWHRKSSRIHKTYPSASEFLRCHKIVSFISKNEAENCRL